MKFHPILFSTEMVKAILEGRKTQTRRVVKPQPADHYFQSLVLHATGRYTFAPNDNYNPNQEDILEVKNKYGNLGDVLWVRESFTTPQLMDGSEPDFLYKAGGVIQRWGGGKFKPSIHMPKTACRIFLQIKSIRVERLHDITEADAIAEGVWQYDDGDYKNYCTKLGYGEADGVCATTAKASFQTLWWQINGIDSWKANPFVWVIEFQPIPKPATFNP